MIGVIDRFDGDFEFLSNFYNVPIIYEGITYPSVENAFQATKFKGASEQETMEVRSQFAVIHSGKAKRLGKKIPLRKDWDIIKDNVMLNLVIQKFNHPELASKLLQTGDALIVEGNYWHDNYWGVCTCSRCETKKHHNKLGKILMETRRRIQSRG